MALITFASPEYKDKTVYAVAGSHTETILKIAKANDWWFHVRGMPGSHVLLRSRDGEEPDRQTLKAAAAIAAVALARATSRAAAAVKTVVAAGRVDGLLRQRPVGGRRAEAGAAVDAQRFAVD